MEEFKMELKRCLFGGYERESVLDYIQSLMEQLERTQMELDKARSLCQTMSGQNEQLYSQLTGLNGNMERLFGQLSEQKGQLDGYRAREAQLKEREAGAQSLLQEAEYRASAMVEEARQEQERLTMEALRVRKKAIFDTEQRLNELRALAEGLWGLLDGAGNAGREVS